MSPIRVGIIGLSSRTTYPGFGSWAGVAHLPFLLASPAYEVTAITGRSAESARNALAAHKLPSTIKIYTNAQNLAADPNVDLVVVSVSVGQHYELARSALEAGKDLFVEWPLGASTQEAEELSTLAAQKGVKTVVGLQARASKLVETVKRIIASGQIGKVISSNVLGSSSFISSLTPTPVWMEGAEYYLDMKSGGNEYTIFFGHFLDSFVSVLGDFDSLQATLKTQMGTIPILNKEGKVVNPSYRKTSPDHILVQGVLASGAVASIAYRRPLEAVDDKAVRWIITGTEGEIAITTDTSQWQVSDASMKLQVKTGKSDTRIVDFNEGEPARDPAWQHEAYNVASTYDAFAKGEVDKYATFESALKTHKLLDRIVNAAGFKY